MSSNFFQTINASWSKSSCLTGVTRVYEGVSQKILLWLVHISQFRPPCLNLVQCCMTAPPAQVMTLFNTVALTCIKTNHEKHFRSARLPWPFNFGQFCLVNVMVRSHWSRITEKCLKSHSSCSIFKVSSLSWLGLSFLQASSRSIVCGEKDCPVMDLSKVRSCSDQNSINFWKFYS